MEPWIQLLIQIPLVAAFMWFVLTWSDRLSTQQSQRDLQWREFLNDQRMALLEGLVRVADDLKANTQQLKELSENFTERMSGAEKMLEWLRAAWIAARADPLETEEVRRKK